MQDLCENDLYVELCCYPRTHSMVSLKLENHIGQTFQKHLEQSGSLKSATVKQGALEIVDVRHWLALNYADVKGTVRTKSSIKPFIYIKTLLVRNYMFL